MVSSAIFGAAAGTGLALVVAMTIVVYRYYAVKRKRKWNWSNLDRWPDPPIRSNNDDQPHHHYCHVTPTSLVLDCWKKPQKSYYAVQTGVSLPHQSRSYPGGGGSGGRTLARNSSVSSQSSLEGASCPSSHRGSSPQIRAFGPDGRHHPRHDPLHTASSYPPSRSS
ncbi:hypothetical protein P5V15_011432, partial [Pogonomyrmex californicus]